MNSLFQISKNGSLTDMCARFQCLLLPLCDQIVIKFEIKLLGKSFRYDLKNIYYLKTEEEVLLNIHISWSPLTVHRFHQLTRGRAWPVRTTLAFFGWVQDWTRACWLIWYHGTWIRTAGRTELLSVVAVAEFVAPIVVGITMFVDFFTFPLTTRWKIITNNHNLYQ